MDRFETIKELIQKHFSIVEFADFGEGVSDDWIDKAEVAIGLTFPQSYRWWLHNYGGGEIGGEEIFSIYGDEFDSVVGGDVVHMYRVALQDANSRRDRIPICHSDVDGVFCFDASKGLRDNEYPVFSEAAGKNYARDFLLQRLLCGRL
jgi:hypothetical protein